MQTLDIYVQISNIARTFVSPLRQTAGDRLHIYSHIQPEVTARMVTHLRGLPIRERVGQIGFGAYCTIVVVCDNQTGATLWEAAPAPQRGERDHYETFINRITRFYGERFAILS